MTKPGVERLRSVREAQRAAADVLHPAFWRHRVEMGAKHPALVIETPAGARVKKITFSSSPRCDHTYSLMSQALDRWLKERAEEDLDS